MRQTFLSTVCFFASSSSVGSIMPPMAAACQRGQLPPVTAGALRYYTELRFRRWTLQRRTQMQSHHVRA